MPGIAQPPDAATSHVGAVAAPAVLSLVRELHPFAHDELLTAIACAPRRRRAERCRFSPGPPPAPHAATAANRPRHPDGAAPACHGCRLQRGRQGFPAHRTGDRSGNPPRFAVARPRRGNSSTIAAG